MDYEQIFMEICLLGGEGGYTEFLRSYYWLNGQESFSSEFYPFFVVLFLPFLFVHKFPAICQL